jgi:hypothetical protein
MRPRLSSRLRAVLAGALALAAAGAAPHVPLTAKDRSRHALGAGDSLVAASLNDLALVRKWFAGIAWPFTARTLSRPG